VVLYVARINDTEYADLRPNRTICFLYADAMPSQAINSLVMCDFSQEEPGPASTDERNVPYINPTFHGVFAIPYPSGAYNLTTGFIAYAGTDEAHDLAIVTSKSMAIAGSESVK